MLSGGPARWEGWGSLFPVREMRVRLLWLPECSSKYRGLCRERFGMDSNSAGVKTRRIFGLYFGTRPRGYPGRALLQSGILKPALVNRISTQSRKLCRTRSRLGHKCFVLRRPGLDGINVDFNVGQRAFHSRAGECNG